MNKERTVNVSYSKCLGGIQDAYTVKHQRSSFLFRWIYENLERDKDLVVTVWADEAHELTCLRLMGCEASISKGPRDCEHRLVFKIAPKPPESTLRRKLGVLLGCYAIDNFIDPNPVDAWTTWTPLLD